MSCKIIVLLFGLWTLCDGARILAFFPFPSKSHHAVFRPIMQRLAEKGHDITYYSPFPMNERPKRLKIVDISSSIHVVQNSSNLIDDAQREDTSHWYNHHQFEKMAREAVQKSIVLPAVQELLLSDEKYDLLLTTASPCQYSVLPLAHKFNVSIVQILPAGNFMSSLEDVGANENPAYMTHFLSPFSDQMNFEERLRNTMHWVINRLTYPFMIMKHQDFVDKYMRYRGWKQREPLQKMASKTAVFLVNSHFSAGYLFPAPSNHKEIGGVNVLPSKPLPEEIKQFLDNAVNGAIYFSMGSLVKTSELAGNENVRKAFTNVFKTMNKRVLWKWESDELPEKQANVMFSKWFPQQDILAHKNIKLFVTQGGMISIFEAVSHGVPLLGIPIFVDQYKNIKHATTYGYGLTLTANNLTEASLRWALEEILNNPSYRKEAERRAQLFHDRPRPPVDEAVYWIEHVLKHGPVLSPTSASLPFYKLYLLDVLGIICVFFTISCTVIYRIAGLIYRKLSVKMKTE